MLRTTVRILGFLLLAFGFVLWQMRAGKRLVAPSVRPPVATASKSPTRHKIPRSPVPVEKKPSPVAPLLALNVVPFVAAGAGLFVISFFLPKSKAPSGSAIQKGTSMSLPEKWDERQITLDIGRYRADQGLRSKYLGGIVTESLKNRSGVLSEKV